MIRRFCDHFVKKSHFSHQIIRILRQKISEYNNSPRQGLCYLRSFSERLMIGLQKILQITFPKNINNISKYS